MGVNERRGAVPPGGKRTGADGAGAPARTGGPGAAGTWRSAAVAGPAPAEPETFRVDIGELVLTGFGRSLDPDRVTAAFEAELGRLVRERGVPLAADGAGRVVDALGGLPPLPPNLTSRRLGQELARAVHEGLAGQGEAR